MTWAQGMGRHSVDEINKIGDEDCRALSVYLGIKSHLLHLLYQILTIHAFHFEFCFPLQMKFQLYTVFD